jgi:DNA repair exonuclease SbcCD ATPase subunit
MNFKSVHLVNFLSFKDQVFELENRGLTLILGDNRGTSSKDSNGAGKSTLLDAFCWGLWGSTVKGIKDDEVVNWVAGKNCSVSVEFEDQGNTYKVIRYRKCKDREPINGLRLTINGEDATQASVKATQERILHILDLDFHTFQCMMPGAAVKVAQLTDSGIKQTLESLLQLEVFADASSIAKDKANKLQSSLIALEAPISVRLQLIDKNKATIAMLENSIDAFELAKEARVSAARAVLVAAKSRVSAVLARPFSEFIEKEEELILLKNELLVLEARLEATSKKAQKDYSRKYSKFAAEENKLTQSEYAIKPRLHLVRERIKGVAKLGGECSECSQAVDDEHKNKVIAKLGTEETALAEELRALAETNHKIRSSNSAELLKQSKEVDCAVNDLAEHKQKIEDVLLKLVNVAALKELLELHKASVERAKLGIAKCLSESCNLPDSLLAAKATLFDSERELAEAEASRLLLQKDLDVQKFWVEAFGSKGLRPHLLRHVTPLLNRKVQQYADIATQGDMKIEFETEKTQKNGKTKAIFSIKVSHKDGGNSYKSSSSGEKARADVCIALALGDLAAARSSKSVNFRFMDEPFENIDNSGLAGIVALLTHQGTNFGSIFCVTHNQSLKEYFPSTITVIKEKKVSRIQ